MDPVVMIVVGLAVLGLPFALMVVFHGRDKSDSRGRRIDSRWRARRWGRKT